MSVDTKKFEIRESKYGLGLFYIGKEDISISQDIFTETPFFKPPNKIEIAPGITSSGSSATMAYYSLIADDSIKKRLDEFKIGETTDEFKKKIRESYNHEIRLLYNNNQIKSRGYMIKDIGIEITRMALYRLCCNSILKYKDDHFEKDCYEWGFFEFATRVNHSCDPNMEILDTVCEQPYEDGKICGKLEGEIKFRAIKNIKTNDELTFSYVRKEKYINEKTRIFDENAYKQSLLSDYGFVCKCSHCFPGSATKVETTHDKGKRKSKRRSKRLRS